MDNGVVRNLGAMTSAQSFGGGGTSCLMFGMGAQI